MANHHSGLSAIGAVDCIKTSDGSVARLPRPPLFMNIRLLWQFLELVMSDWKRDAGIIQQQIDAATSDNEKLSFGLQALVPLQTRYLQCLFSYAFFFVALRDVYGLFYFDLNKLNHQTGLHVGHSKPPRPTAYIQKVELIRDLGIAHVGNPRDKSERGALDAWEAMLWQPMSWSPFESEQWQIETLTFGSGQGSMMDRNSNIILQSSDLEIKGMIELDDSCSGFLGQYDDVCADYLNGIRERLPVTNDNITYAPLDASTSVIAWEWSLTRRVNPDPRVGVR